MFSQNLLFYFYSIKYISPCQKSIKLKSVVDIYKKIAYL